MGSGLVILYRICTKKRAGDLSGTGTRLYGGRWNSPGKPVIYTSENISLAMLEVLAHSDRSMLRQEYALTSIRVPKDTQILQLNPDELPETWKNFPFDPVTAVKGDEWLKSQSSLILKLPSAVNPFEYNLLLNPSHSLFHSIKIEGIRPVSFDLRFA